MEVTSFIGPSGTGKSYRAMLISRDRGIDYIIDDGLLIKGNKIIAGMSAKREGTKLAAVRRAMFMDEDHRRTVAKAIEQYLPDRILVLGTSDKMVDSIVEALGLPPVSHRIHINDVASPAEINIARKHRYGEGKHVIPVPTFEVRKDFSGYFLDTLKIFGVKKDKTADLTEKTVVRPTYSYMGRYTINERVLVQIAKYVAEGIDGVNRIAKVDIIGLSGGIAINMDIILTYGVNIMDTVRAIQSRVKSEIEYMTFLNVLSVNLDVKSLSIE